MFSMRLDNTNRKEKKYSVYNIKGLNKIELIITICEAFYENNIRFILCDEYCNDFGMDCKYDLPCLLENFDEIIYNIIKGHSFSIEFYEQGREYIYDFGFCGKRVKIQLKSGLDGTNLRKYETDSVFLKNTFRVIFNDVIRYAKCYITGVESNKFFLEWENMLSQF